MQKIDSIWASHPFYREGSRERTGEQCYNSQLNISLSRYVTYCLHHPTHLQPCSTLLHCIVTLVHKYYKYAFSIELQTKVLENFAIMKKTPTRALSWLKAVTTSFTFKTLLRHSTHHAWRNLNLKCKASEEDYHQPF